MKLSESKKYEKICKRYLFLVVIAMFFAGCGGASREDLFDKTVPQNQVRDVMFVVTEWQCEYCGEIIVQSSYGNGDAYGYPPLKDCKRNPGFAHSYTMTRWKSYDWDYNANTWKYGRGEDRRKKEKEETPPKAEQSTATVATESKPTSSATSKPKTDSPAPSTNQGTPVQVLRMFHENITNKNYRKAYNCLSKDFQAAVSYEGWTPGFRTTVSSTVSDVKTVSQTSDRVVLTYTLKAVDNPGGTQYFQGTTILVKTSEGWKIDDITQ